AGRIPVADSLRQARDLAATVGVPGVERYIRRFRPPVSFRPGSAREAGYLTWAAHLPLRFDRHAATIGIPLLAAASPEAVYQVPRWRIVAQNRPRIGTVNANHYRRLVTEAIGVEHALWEIAADETGNAGFRMPYAFRYFALGWLWHPHAHDGGFAFSLCLRCGALLYRNRAPLPRRGRDATPLCDHCAKEPPAARKW